MQASVGLGVACRRGRRDVDEPVDGSEGLDGCSESLFDAGLVREVGIDVDGHALRGVFSVESLYLCRLVLVLQESLLVGDRVN